MQSTLDLTPEVHEFGVRVEHPVAMPGVTELNRTV